MSSITRTALRVEAQIVANETTAGANTASRVGGVFTDIVDSGVFTDKVSLSSAQILALNATPQGLVAAPGAGKVIQPLFYLINYTYGTITYATNTNMRFYYQGIPTLGVVSNSMLTRTASYMMRQTSASTTAFAFDLAGNNPTNKALVVDVETGNPTAGDGIVDIYITYAIISL